MSDRFETMTVKGIQALDRIAIEECGVPSIALMENAGRSVAKEVVRSVPSKERGKLLVVCGIGNNAGDGFVAVRHLLNAGYQVETLLIGQESHLKKDALTNFQVLKNIGHVICSVKAVTQEVQEKVFNADVIVDAIFGVGLNREIEGLFKEMITLVNDSRRDVVSVDIPSGLNGDTGEIYGVCIKAKETITFTFAKKGFLQGAGPSKTGKIKVVDIGIPRILCEKVNGC